MRRYRGNELAMIFQEPMTSLNPVLRIGKQLEEAIMLHLGYGRKKRGSMPSIRSNSSAFRGRTRSWTTIRTNCPAACASGS